MKLGQYSMSGNLINVQFEGILKLRFIHIIKIICNKKR